MGGGFMYVTSIDKQDFLRLPLLGSLSLKFARDGHVFRVAFLISCYPCGRLKLIAPSAGYCITGDISNNCKDVVFDSVKSVYTVPGLSVITPPGAIYSACNMIPRSVWR